jgi:glyoxylase-like metal-dependent hydrolase (beta-lactamase superfamily II)
MKLKIIPAGIYEANCYILIDENTRQSAVIDPGGDEEILIKAIKNSGTQVRYILLTHGHIDHTGAVEALKKEFNAPVYINEKDYQMIKNKEHIYGDINGKIDKYINDGDLINLANSEIKCIYTPGHTPGGVCFLVDNLLFTGDTLFAGSIGRTDFAGGDFSIIINSIKTKLMGLPDDIIVLPGHGTESTIGEERKHNPYL